MLPYLNNWLSFHCSNNAVWEGQKKKESKRKNRTRNRKPWEEQWINYLPLRFLIMLHHWIETKHFNQSDDIISPFHLRTAMTYYCLHKYRSKRITLKCIISEMWKSKKRTITNLCSSTRELWVILLKKLKKRFFRQFKRFFTPGIKCFFKWCLQKGSLGNQKNCSSMACIHESPFDIFIFKSVGYKI